MSENTRTCECNPLTYSPIIFNTVGYQNSSNTIYESKNPIECSFIGSISDFTLTVTGVTFGALAVGNTITGTGVAAGTMIAAFIGGSGNTGTYRLTISQSLTSTALLARGSTYTQGNGQPAFKSDYERMQYKLGKNSRSGAGVSKLSLAFRPN